MQFLLLNQFYLPDTAPTGWYLHDLARTLVQRGHEVKVICSRKAYDGHERYPARDYLDGVQVTRLPATGFGRRSFVGKLADYGSFYGAALLATLLRRDRPDLVVSLTTPPYLGLLGKIAAWKARCPRVHWIMDLYPDVMCTNGKSQATRFRFLRAMTRLELRGSAGVVALGPMMAERVAPYLPGRDGFHSVPGSEWGRGWNASLPIASCLHSLPLWSDPALSPWPADEPNPLRTQRNWKPDDLVLLYSGNMGLGHRFGEFLDAAARLGRQGPRWVFAGGGKRRQEIGAFARAHPQARIEFLDYVSHSDLRAHLCAGDVHLASLDASWQGLIVPSKVQASFAVGRPVLFVGGGQCEPATWIRESAGGWVIRENDVEGLLEAISQAGDAAERRKRGQAALAYAREHFRMTTNCGRLATYLEDVARGRRRGPQQGAKDAEVDFGEHRTR